MSRTATRLAPGEKMPCVADLTDLAAQMIPERQVRGDALQRILLVIVHIGRHTAIEEMARCLFLKRILPCPHCDHGQRLQWGGRDVDYGIKWPADRPRTTNSPQ